MLKNLLRGNVLHKLTTAANLLEAGKAPQHNLKTTLRFFHRSTVKLAKLFIESENAYAYSILQKIPIAKSAIFVAKTPDKLIATEQDFNKFLTKNWRNATASETVQAFKDVVDFCVSNGIAVSDNRFDQLVDGLMDNIEKLTDEEICDLMKCLIKFPLCESYDSHNFHDVWSALDDICLVRMPKWSLEKRFYVAELWYRLNLGRLCDYNFQFTDKLQDRAMNMSLTKQQLVHTFFYLNITRKRTVQFEFEYLLEKVIDELSADEMGIVAMGYFKTETKIKLLPIIEAMCRKIVQEHATIHEISLAAILKTLRHSSHIKSGEMLYTVLDHVEAEIPRLSNPTCIHIALLGTILSVYHEKCLSKVVDKLVADLDNPEKLRLKEIERLLLATTMFDYENANVPDFYERCLREMKKENRRAERAKYRRCVPCALNYLSIRKIFDYELMNEVLDKDYIYTVYGRTTLPRELMVLDYSIEIECPDYRGNRLSDKSRNVVVKLTSEYIPLPEREKHSVANKLFLKVQKAVNNVIGDANLSLPLHILPHFSKADIILCKNTQTNKFVSPKVFDDFVLIDLKHPIKDKNLKWYALVVLSYNQTIRETPTPLGLMNMKARQLKALGYEPIFLPWYDIYPKTYEEVVEFLRSKLC